MLTRYGRLAHMAATWLFVGAVLVQGYLAGQALAQLGGNGDFSAHAGFGYSVLGILALAVLVTALVGREPRRQVGLSVAVFVLYIVQTLLPPLRASVPAIAALHPANAMVLLVIAVIVAWRASQIGAAVPAG